MYQTAPLAELLCKWFSIPKKLKALTDLKNIFLNNHFQIALN